jgi:hypothetical protein
MWWESGCVGGGLTYIGNQEQNFEIPEPENQTRKYNKRIFPPRPDVGPVTRSKTASKETTLYQIEPHLYDTSVNTAEALNLVKSFDFINPIKLFEKRIAPQKPETSISSGIQNNHVTIGQ